MWKKSPHVTIWCSLKKVLKKLHNLLRLFHEPRHSPDLTLDIMFLIILSFSTSCVSLSVYTSVYLNLLSVNLDNSCNIKNLGIIWRDFFTWSFKRSIFIITPWNVSSLDSKKTNKKVFQKYPFLPNDKNNVNLQLLRSVCRIVSFFRFAFINIIIIFRWFLFCVLCYFLD